MLTVMLTVLLTSCSAQDQVGMTLVDLNHFDSEVDSFYECHLSNPDFTSRDNGSVESFRAGKTKPAESNNQDPPPPVFKPFEVYPHYRVYLDNHGNDDGFGVFGCRVTKDGKLETKISTVRMRSDADITPASGLFTQTVSIDDEDVRIRMESSTQSVDVFVWRHNNSKKMQIGMPTFSIDESIQQDHAGIYECHVDDARPRAKHGIVLLLVRGCPASRWDPPSCNGVCDSCYNGGICDENNGKCVCPPGFKGDNCLTACGGNRFGYFCEKKCSSDGGEESCIRRLFCLVHPFGCRCNSGWKGLGCTTACDINTFGASCLQSCHCTSGQCDRYTGRCTGSNRSCDTGWTGDNCQECDGNFFGSDCSQECHCHKSYCNIESGLCKPGGCLPQWVDLYHPYSCQTGLENVTSAKVNAGATAVVTCKAVEGQGGSLDSLDLFLSKDSDKLELDGITSREILNVATSKVQSFIVNGVDKGDALYCQLRDRNDRRLAVLGPHNIDVFDLPKLTSPPFSWSVNTTSVTITWAAWNDTRDIGDPPVVGYVPYYKKTEEENNWLPGQILPSETLSYTFAGLDPSTRYSFGVAAVREGDDGEGQRSPPLHVTTMDKATHLSACEVYSVIITSVAVVLLLVASLSFIWRRIKKKGDQLRDTSVIKQYYEKDIVSVGVDDVTSLEREDVDAQQPTYETIKDEHDAATLHCPEGLTE